MSARPVLPIHVSQETPRTYVHRHHHRHRPDHLSPDQYPSIYHPRHPDRTLRRQSPQLHFCRRQARVHVARRPQDACPRTTDPGGQGIPGRPGTPLGPDDAQWTGAEIKSCCRLEALLEVPLVEAAQNVVPVAVTAGDKIEGLRHWASGRCLSADRAGVYSRTVSGGRCGLIDWIRGL